MKIYDTHSDIFSNLYERIVNSIEFRMSNEKSKISILSGKLNALSPLDVLSRGYSISYKNNSQITSVSDVSNGDNIKVKVTDGEIFASVTEVKGN